MATAATARAMTVRLEPELHDAALRLARKRGISLNALLQESLASVVKSAEDRDLYEAFERYGAHPDADVSYAHSAQAEVALRNECADGR